MERTTRPQYTLTVHAPEDHLARADVVAGRRFQGLSRRVVRSLGAALYLNDRPIAPSHRVQLGDRLELRLPEVEVQPVAFVALGTTPDFVFVAKPRGVHTHRLRPTDPPALADAVAALHPECAGASPDPREGGALHRLDGPTTGVVAFARHREAWARGRRAIVEGATKIYAAWVNGPDAPCHVSSHEHPRPDVEVLRSLPPPQSCVLIDAPLHDVGRRVRIGPGGRPARTEVWAWPPCGSRRFVLLRLHGGRRHQLRAHLAHVGWPIVGDERYGGAPPDGPLLLHAIRLDLEPGKLPAIEAPLPAGWPPPPS